MLPATSPPSRAGSAPELASFATMTGAQGVKELLERSPLAGAEAPRLLAQPCPPAPSRLSPAPPHGPTFPAHDHIPVTFVCSQTRAPCRQAFSASICPE